MCVEPPGRHALPDALYHWVIRELRNAPAVWKQSQDGLVPAGEVVGEVAHVAVARVQEREIDEPLYVRKVADTPRIPPERPARPASGDSARPLGQYTHLKVVHCRRALSRNPLVHMPKRCGTAEISSGSSSSFGCQPRRVCVRAKQSSPQQTLALRVQCHADPLLLHRCAFAPDEDLLAALPPPVAGHAVCTAGAVQMKFGNVLTRLVHRSVSNAV